MITAERRLAVAAVACCLVGGRHHVAPLPTVPCVDLARYAGTWHEIARLPNLFQRSCACSRARYEPLPDGSLAVVNSCVTSRGRCREVTGRAEPVPCSGNARLRVRFGGLAALVPVPREGNYRIIALDDGSRVRGAGQISGSTHRGQRSACDGARSRPMPGRQPEACE